MTQEEERIWLEKAQLGDNKAFELLMLANQNQVYALALRMLGNEEDARDIAQETFLKAYRSLAAFRGESKLSVWLYRLASNLCIDFLRKKKRDNTSSLSMNGEEEGNGEEYSIPDFRYAPETIMEQKQLQELIQEGLLSLSPEYRQVIILRELFHYSYAEIAQIIEVEEGTVKSRIFRARQKLCKFLMESGNFSELDTSNT